MSSRYVPRDAWAEQFNFVTMMGNIIRETKWEVHDQNRREAFLLRLHNVPYYYGGKRGYEVRPYYAQPEPLSLTMVWDAVNKYTGCVFEACFINYYENQDGNLGWHSDDSPSIDQRRPVVIVSLGQPRTLWMRLYGAPDQITTRLLESGSLFIMGAGMQQTHQHCVQKEEGLMAPRLSLVFRGLSGFIAPEPFLTREHFGDVEYCDCHCHTDPNVRHVAACCGRWPGDKISPR